MGTEIVGCKLSRSCHHVA